MDDRQHLTRWRVQIEVWGKKQRHTDKQKKLAHVVLSYTQFSHTHWNARVPGLLYCEQSWSLVCQLHHVFSTLTQKNLYIFI